MGKREETLRLIFEEPTSAKVSFKAVKSLLEGLGGEYIKSGGSRRKFYFETLGNGRTLSLHEPHGKDLCKAAVEDIRDVLIEMKVRPESS